ncbi:MAG: hypothetical protein Q7S19_02795 [bacterium]|nr:hypothetical protein [bacterium]
MAVNQPTLTSALTGVAVVFVFIISALSHPLSPSDDAHDQPPQVVFNSQGSLTLIL